jgi:tRNA A-37 threonylcarbamoyl transferase component Bud32
MNLSWERVTEVFSTASALNDTARRAFLDAACAGDPDLRAEVEGLLTNHRNDSFLSKSPFSSIGVDAQAVLPSGLVLKDRYVIEQRLAAGGQGHVYRATDRLLSRSVVVKVMRAGEADVAMLRRRFEQEMQALSCIDHPAVVGIFDVGDLRDGCAFLVIQYIDGTSLAEALQQGPLDRTRAVRIIKDIAGALHAAHAAGVAHNDLKPQNVMLQRLGDGGEVVKLIDFGIAKIDRADLQPAITTVMIAGSVRYMAPEQFEGRNLPASDVYSLGLLACEMLYGYPDVRALPKHVPRKVRELLEAAVAFLPEDRPTDVTAWASDLGDAVLRGAPNRRRMLLGILVATALAWPVYDLLSRPLERNDRIIEKIGAFDPLVEGFSAHNNVSGTVIFNEERTAYIGWQIAGTHAGDYYYRKLTDHEKQRALGRGWILSAVMRPDEGNAYVVVDFAGHGKRFDIDLLAEPAAYVVRLNTQIVPTLQGMEWRLPRDNTTYHKYELRFDPGLQTADLWVDGEKRVTRYPGHTQFQDDMGLFFGAGPYQSPLGLASFLSLRFEISP